MDSRTRKRKPISFESVKDNIPDRTYYVKDIVKRLEAMLSASTKELYHSLSMAFSLDHIDFHQFKEYIWPIISSGAAFIVGEYLTTRMSQYYTESDEYDYVFKFILGSAILGYCVANRITEKRLESRAAISAAVASEVLSITYLYASTFTGSRMLLNGRLSDSYSLIASFGASALAVPGGIAYLAKKIQQRKLKKLYDLGGQRSDTALIQNGLTPISNVYLQLHHFLLSELSTSSRLFQLGLISDNIFNSQSLLTRFRNLPALMADLGPSTIKKLISQHEKIEHDYRYNTTTQKVLKFTKNGAEWLDVPRYQLRKGDLVYCDGQFDVNAVPVSGELVALVKNIEGQFTNQLEQKKFSVNLKAHNGEDVWIEQKSKPIWSNHHPFVDLHAIHDGRQAGVLVGDKLNLYGCDNFFIEIKAEKEHAIVSDYEKKSIINQIITDRKQRNVIYSIISSIGMGAFLALFVHRDITKLPSESIRLLFNLFHMMIQFSESILREMVNSRLMKEINHPLASHPMETVDALRIVDLCNALAGYYHHQFPNGVAIVTDKTGTLTTSEMDVLGFWTAEMNPDVQNLLKQDGALLLPDEGRQSDYFEVFATAYTNNKKELEPEEHSLLQEFKKILGDDDCLDVHVEGNNHFIKTIALKDKTKSIETYHLGLYRSMGGRLTLAYDEGQYYLVFCGVPKLDQFKDTPLLKLYSSMQTRMGVLSRDWCIARTTISEEQFNILKAYFYEEDKKNIELFMHSHPDILNNLAHYCTFIIDNPVKKGAEKFISQCLDINVPVFIATGDTAKAAENIAKVLCRESADNIITIYASNIDSIDKYQVLDSSHRGSTIIFSGIDEQILALLKDFMDRDSDHRPTIIFSEMSTEGKGLLVQFLKANHFFVVANGDGSNDVMMMKNADMVIAHLGEDSKYAPGVEQLSNLSDQQLKNLFNSDLSFYELFDIHKSQSEFIKLFAPLSNSQEKPSIALTLKSSKMGFELARSMGIADVKDMPHQHWFGVAFDMIWFWISFNEINKSSDLPADNKNLNETTFLDQCILVTMVAAFLQSLSTYLLSGESTNITTMVIMLSVLPLILKSIFSAFGDVQRQHYPENEYHRERSIFSFFNKNPFIHRSNNEPRFELLGEDAAMTPSSS